MGLSDSVRIGQVVRGRIAESLGGHAEELELYSAASASVFLETRSRAYLHQKRAQCFLEMLMPSSTNAEFPCPRKWPRARAPGG